MKSPRFRHVHALAAVLLSLAAVGITPSMPPAQAARAEGQEPGSPDLSAPRASPLTSPTDRTEPAQVGSLRITILDTNLAGDLGEGVGEWGFSALVEADGRRLLFDTGQRPDTVLRNLSELSLNLSDVTDVVLSHNHDDHTGGLLALRRSLAARNPAALSRAHVAAGAFVSRGPGDFHGDDNPLLALRAEYEATGGFFSEHSGPVALAPGVWFTGPIPRVHPGEQPVPKGWVLRAEDGTLVPDSTPEDAALVFDTAKGLVVLTGCGHAGLINTLEYARVITHRPEAPIHAALGGFHLAHATDTELTWTADHLRRLGLRHLHGAHCTGLESLYQLRAKVGLRREAAVVGAVGSWFDLTDGIHPLSIAR